VSETKTPRTDALIGKVTAGMNEPDDSEIVWLIDHARQLETELAAEQQARVAAEIALRAWHNVFGTTQLSHAHAGFEAATERAERAEARAQELEKALKRIVACAKSDIANADPSDLKRIADCTAVSAGVREVAGLYLEAIAALAQRKEGV